MSLVSDSPDRVQDLVASSRPVLQRPGHFDWAVPDGWQQGRGAFGGLVLAAMLRAVEASEPDPARQLRSLTATLCGPTLPGHAELQLTLVRGGSGVSTWGATLRQEDEVRARMTAILGKPRGIALPFAPPPRVPSPHWQQLPVAPLGPPLTPVFTRHFAFRSSGPVPFSGASEPHAAGWVQPRQAGTALGMPEVVALADAWWPAALGMEPQPRPIGTIAFTLQPLLHTPLPADEPLFHSAEVLDAHDGFVVEQRELRTADGRRLALNQQTFVWIR